MPPATPPLLQYFLALHLYLKVMSAMRRPFQAIYVGVWSPPPPLLAGPLGPPRTQPPPPIQAPSVLGGGGAQNPQCG